VERFDRTLMRGYVHPQSYLQENTIELLTLEGAVVPVPYAQIKAVCFVRDLDGPAIFSERKEFLARPKTQGLWVEARFRDGDRLEGLLPNNLAELESTGYSLMPPEVSGNTQKVFLPRAALAQLVVLGVVGTPRRTARARKPEERQISLFGDSSSK